eukprot:TRINITY_DN26745_c0_g1_i1.p1 TRINITY_DN26745_c0_g1~~TRINITY_DN26745_c0_g1_i1.p1  ORF type:complete len:534 (+),score=66.73 TRINITY_DN26745_c0_g1_i1:236-1837(+)
MVVPERAYLEMLDSMSTCALDLVRSGRIEEAAELNGDCFELRKAVLGPTHEDTLFSMANHAFCLGFLGLYEEAEEQQRLCTALREEVLGLEHPDTLRSLANHAVCLCQLGRYDESEELQRRCWQLRRRVLGIAHPDTLISMVAHARALRSLSRVEEAEEQERQCSQLRKTLAGKQSDFIPGVPFSADTGSLGRWDKAEEQLRNCASTPQEQQTLAPLEELCSYEYDQRSEQTDCDDDICCICFLEFNAGNPPASHTTATDHGIVFICGHAKSIHLSCLLREATQGRPFRCPLCRCKFGFAKRCICGIDLQKRMGTDPVPGYSGCRVTCSHCDKVFLRTDTMYHCTKGKVEIHPKGFDVCARCAGEDQDSHKSSDTATRQSGTRSLRRSRSLAAVDALRAARGVPANRRQVERTAERSPDADPPRPTARQRLPHRPIASLASTMPARSRSSLFSPEGSEAMRAYGQIMMNTSMNLQHTRPNRAARPMLEGSEAMRLAESVLTGRSNASFTEATFSTMVSRSLTSGARGGHRRRR